MIWFDMTKILALLAIVSLPTFAHAEQQQSRSFYDSRGGFAGSSTTRSNSSSFYNERGQFSGSAIRNSDGTTSFYDGHSRFTGSSHDATQPR